MINVFIAYDQDDYSLGTFFQSSFDNISATCAGLPEVVNTNIPSNGCEEYNINYNVSLKNDNPFIFIALSHGTPDGSCLISHQTYISDANSSEFKNCFFYTTACCVANKLGPDLISNGCICFIGCNNSSYATYDAFFQTYQDCENYAIKEFLSTDKTADQTFVEMKEYFDEQINDLFSKNEIFVAMELLHNKDSMVLIGDGTITRNNFIV